ncbi:MAG: glycosyltransferase [Blautia sp.]|nr:glycosyltransferase [Blautia sp.]MCM1200763.1 glycosyltransferase [Bacteroides fragilis]
MTDISVIVPIYNVESYLEECLDSLVAQTYENMEFICINDGSTDSSLEILCRYAEKDSRIKVIDKENEGYGKTMNKGLELAVSPWIGIVESDDFIKPDMFETLYKASKGSSVDLIKCNFYKYKIKEGKDIAYSNEYPKRFFGKEICPLEEPEVYDAHSSIWAGIYRKAFLDANHIRFHETPGASYQDISFHFKVIFSAEKIKIIEDALIYYRTDNVNSSVYNPSKIFCISDEMHFIEEYIREQTEERQTLLWPVFTRKKFYDYKWNYMRLAPEFQYTFFRLMAEEFAADEKEGKFEKVCWRNENHKKELLEIIENPFAYFTCTKSKKYVDERIKIIGTINKKIYLKGILQEIRDMKVTVIYGAGVRGKWVAERLLEKGIPKSKLMFAVSKKGEENEVMGIAVTEISMLAPQKEDIFVIIAVKEDTQIELLENLNLLEIENVILADEEFRKSVQISIG